MLDEVKPQLTVIAIFMILICVIKCIDAILK